MTRAEAGRHLPPPVAQLLDPPVDQLGRRHLLPRSALRHTSRFLRFAGTIDLPTPSPMHCLTTPSRRRRSGVAWQDHGGAIGAVPRPAPAGPRVLRRVRDRMDREYAQPLDVEALARGNHMSAGHLSRQFGPAYGESPYSYLMARRIERAMALLRHGDLSVTEVCSPLAARRSARSAPASPSWSECRPAPTAAEATYAIEGMPPCVARRVGGPIRNREAPTRWPQSRMIPVDITIHQTFLPHTDPDASLAFYRDTLGFEVRNDVEYQGMHWIRSAPPTSRAPPSSWPHPAPTPASPRTSAARSPR